MVFSVSSLEGVLLVVLLVALLVVLLVGPFRRCAVCSFSLAREWQGKCWPGAPMVTIAGTESCQKLPEAASGQLWAALGSSGQLRAAPGSSWQPPLAAVSAIPCFCRHNIHGMLLRRPSAPPPLREAERKSGSKHKRTTRYQYRMSLLCRNPRAFLRRGQGERPIRATKVVMGRTLGCKLVLTVRCRDVGTEALGGQAQGMRSKDLLDVTNVILKSRVVPSTLELH